MDSIPIIIGIVVGFVAVGGAAYQVYSILRQTRLSTARISRAEASLQAEPEKVKPAWDLARATLEAYLNRNLTQISAIFFLTMLVMIIGFGITIWGVVNSLRTPSSLIPSILASTVGIITQFIGATFLIIYRSTIQQAASYSRMLERINSVGMAMQILDTIPEQVSSDDIKSKTKAVLVELLVKEAHSLERQENVSSS